MYEALEKVSVKTTGKQTINPYHLIHQIVCNLNIHIFRHYEIFKMYIIHILSKKKKSKFH